MLTRRGLLKTVAAICWILPMGKGRAAISGDWFPVKKIYRVGGYGMINHYRLVLGWNSRVTVFATQRHSILTRKRGWLRLSELNKGDEINRSYIESDAVYGT